MTTDGEKSDRNKPLPGDDGDPRLGQLVRGIRSEFGQMQVLVEELEALDDDIGEDPATLRERAAASAFLASFYMGVENILKRIVRYQNIDLPQGERWHVELFKQFCALDSASSVSNVQNDRLPDLFEGDLIRHMDAYRRFRHVFHHGYERDLDYDRMRPGIQGARPVLKQFREAVGQYLSSLLN